MSIERVNILGVRVSAINMTMAIDTINTWIQEKRQNYVCVTPVHSIMLCQDDENLRHIYNTAGLVTPDGMPVVWLCQLQGFRHVERVYGPDLMMAICQHSMSNGYRHFFYGSTTSTLRQLEANLKDRFPNLQVAGSYSPPFGPLTVEEDEEIINIINAAEPDIVWVGLGAPKQELWMYEHLGRIKAPTLIGVGAAFDFHANVKKQAPLWMQRNGLEWLFRFISEPHRLWRRYLINNPLFIFLILLQYLKSRRYSVML